jgi:hypothetical protein
MAGLECFVRWRSSGAKALLLQDRLMFSYK